ncbi:hypothetical protein [Colwellia sp. Arc7-D]|uniref:hypothetical protein n=1 Tax=Colwellia sp. Arc7-D TaxID=2161872 RepID=UPI000D383CB2|nr:hypothetical protein [Colwellia sp. Arc7-D]AWB58264.1 hypothetical protein DBO93_12250 [Colwellia sp. Arc7-D]
MIDDNDDGIKEGLNIKFDVSVVFDGSYEAFMSFGERRDSLFFIKEIFELTAGDHEINIFVSAQRLVNAKAEGEIPLTTFHFNTAKSLNWPTETRHNFGLTPSFSCKDFEDCTIRLPKPVTCLDDCSDF